MPNLQRGLSKGLYGIDFTLPNLAHNQATATSSKPERHHYHHIMKAKRQQKAT